MCDDTYSNKSWFIVAQGMFSWIIIHLYDILFEEWEYFKFHVVEMWLILFSVRVTIEGKSYKSQSLLKSERNPEMPFLYAAQVSIAEVKSKILNCFKVFQVRNQQNRTN
jgi:hypothetical protein